MGVIGLTSLLNGRGCQTNLGNIADELNTSTILVDGPAVFWWLWQQALELDVWERTFIAYPSIVRFEQLVVQFHELFSKAGIELIWYFDTVSVADDALTKVNTWKLRHDFSIQETLHYQQWLHDMSEEKSYWRIMPQGFYEAKNELEKIAKVKNCLGEADHSLAVDGVHNGAILSGDSDFFLMRDIVFIPLDSFDKEAVRLAARRDGDAGDVRALDCTYFRAKDVARMINVPVSLFPELSFMVGNDYTKPLWPELDFHDLPCRRTKAGTPNLMDVCELLLSVAQPGQLVHHPTLSVIIQNNPQFALAVNHTFRMFDLDHAADDAPVIDHQTAKLQLPPAAVERIIKDVQRGTLGSDTLKMLFHGFYMSPIIVEDLSAAHTAVDLVRPVLSLTALLLGRNQLKVFSCRNYGYEESTWMNLDKEIGMPSSLISPDMEDDPERFDVYRKVYDRLESVKLSWEFWPPLGIVNDHFFLQSALIYYFAANHSVSAPLTKKEAALVTHHAVLLLTLRHVTEIPVIHCQSPPNTTGLRCASIFAQYSATVKALQRLAQVLMIHCRSISYYADGHIFAALWNLSPLTTPDYTVCLPQHTIRAVVDSTWNQNLPEYAHDNIYATYVDYFEHAWKDISTALKMDVAFSDDGAVQRGQQHVLQQHEKPKQQQSQPKPPKQQQSQPKPPNQQQKKENTVTSSLEFGGLGELQSNDPPPAPVKVKPEKLPIMKHREKILRHIENNPVTIIQGDTGCGKSSRVPVFLLETAYQPFIVVTQPRRVAARALADRVASERNEPVGDKVGFLIGQDRSATSSTQLLFVTTGWLLQKFLFDRSFFLKCTHIVLDEIHERSMDSDMLSYLIKQLTITMPEDAPKLIVMSATLDAMLFAEYFSHSGNPVPQPLVVGVKRFKVEIKYLEDLSQTFQHLSPLVMRAVGKLSDLFDRGGIPSRTQKDDLRALGADMCGNLAANHQKDKTGNCVLVFLPGVQEIDEMYELLQLHKFSHLMELMTLHSLLEKEDQMLPFTPITSGITRIVLATNIAESSITLPGVRYVIDFGTHKQIFENPKFKCQCLREVYTSRASAQQRSGRAGRLFPGTAFRLYTQHYFESCMESFDEPEMTRVSLSTTVLRLKLMESSIEDGAEIANPYRALQASIQPPKKAAIDSAFDTLVQLEALSHPDQKEASRGRDPQPFNDATDVTVLGRFLASLPLSLNVGKFVFFGALSEEYICHALIIACGLSMLNLFVMPNSKWTDRKKYFSLQESTLTARRKLDTTHDDCFLILEIFCKYMSVSNAKQWAFKHSLHYGRLQDLVRTVRETARRIIPHVPHRAADRLQTLVRERSWPALQVVLSNNLQDKAAMKALMFFTFRENAMIGVYQPLPVFEATLENIPSSLSNDISWLPELQKHVATVEVLAPKGKNTKASQSSSMRIVFTDDQASEDDTMFAKAERIVPYGLAYVDRIFYRKQCQIVYEELDEEARQYLRNDDGEAQQELRAILKSNPAIAKNKWRLCDSLKRGQGLYPRAELGREICPSSQFSSTAVLAVAPILEMSGTSFVADRLSLLPRENGLVAIVTLACVELDVTIGLEGHWITDITIEGLSKIELDPFISVAIFPILTMLRRAAHDFIRDCVGSIGVGKKVYIFQAIGRLCEAVDFLDLKAPFSTPSGDYQQFPVKALDSLLPDSYDFETMRVLAPQANFNVSMFGTTHSGIHHSDFDSDDDSDDDDSDGDSYYSLDDSPSYICTICYKELGSSASLTQHMKEKCKASKTEIKRAINIALGGPNANSEDDISYDSSELPDLLAEVGDVFQAYREKVAKDKANQALKKKKLVSQKPPNYAQPLTTSGTPGTTVAKPKPRSKSKYSTTSTVKADLTAPKAQLPAKPRQSAEQRNTARHTEQPVFNQPSVSTTKANFQAPKVRLPSKPATNPTKINPPQVECKTCGRSFGSMSALDAHRKSKHLHECLKCGRTFKTAKSLEAHIADSHLPKCSTCGRICATVEGLNAHVAAKHLNKCPICNRTFATLKGLDAHVDAKHIWKCQQCNNFFPKESDLNNHRSEVHYNPCPNCNRSFATAKALEAHRRAKHNEVFECKHCDRVCSSLIGLTAHNKAKHQFECSTCNRQFTTSKGYDDHYIAKHV